LTNLSFASVTCAGLMKRPGPVSGRDENEGRYSAELKDLLPLKQMIDKQ